MYDFPPWLFSEDLCPLPSQRRIPFYSSINLRAEDLALVRRKKEHLPFQLLLLKRGHTVNEGHRKKGRGCEPMVGTDMEQDWDKPCFSG